MDKNSESLNNLLAKLHLYWIIFKLNSFITQTIAFRVPLIINYSSTFWFDSNSQVQREKIKIQQNNGTPYPTEWSRICPWWLCYNTLNETSSSWVTTTLCEKTRNANNNNTIQINNVNGEILLSEISLQPSIWHRSSMHAW